MGLKLIAAPDPEPVPLAEVKLALRVDHTADDATLEGYIASAREFIERRIEAKIGVQTWDFVIDEFPAAEIALPFGPVISVESIKYDAEDGHEETVPPASYQLDNTSRRPWVFSLDGWPATLDSFNAV